MCSTSSPSWHKSLGLSDVIPAALKAQERGHGVVIVTLVANRSGEEMRPGARMLVLESGPPLGSLHPLLDPVLLQDARRWLQARRPELRSYRLTAQPPRDVGRQGGDVDIYFDVLARPSRLIIVGAGHIALPLARMAKLADFEVIVLDDREQYANRERFPDADQLLVGPYARTLGTLSVDPYTFIVLVTRGHVHDQACLETVIASGAAYIGMIGSKRRVRTVLGHLRDEGVDPESLAAVRAPVGLDVGARTPAEIAVSILAEIIQVQRGGTGRPLGIGGRLGA